MITKGTLISDRYKVIRSIGEGGMANVYQAEDIILGREVALKVLRGDLSNDEKFLRRFQREALAASSLSHPNIVEMYDVGEEKDLHYIVMEYIDGETLKQLLKRRGHLAVGETVDIMLQIARGIKVAHDSYIIHRDLKPQNIMIKDDGMVKITDFGIAMALNSTQLTQTNSVMGSVHYLPPEQASGKGATIKSDIYSLGILFYELLTGILPFKGDNAVEIALKQLKDPIPSVRAQNASVPQSVENIILRCAAKNPKNRYEDVSELIRDLEVCLNEENLNQDKYVYKYSEVSFDEAVKPVVPKIKDIKEKQNKNNAKEEVITTKMDDELEVKPNKAKVIVWSLLGVLFALLLVMVFYVIPKVKEANRDIKLIDVSGYNYKDAKRALQDAGFSVMDELIKINSASVDFDKVIKTDPEAGTYIPRKRKIQLYVSKGAEKKTLDNYIGRNYRDVKNQLEANGFKVNIIKEKVGTDGNPGVVIKQKPEAGKALEEGGEITLSIPDMLETYPDFVKENWTPDDVDTFAKQYKIILKKEEVENSSFEEGKIFKQSRSAGTKIVPGVDLTIYISKKPKKERPELE